MRYDHATATRRDIPRTMIYDHFELWIAPLGEQIKTWHYRLQAATGLLELIAEQ